MTATEGNCGSRWDQREEREKERAAKLIQVLREIKEARDFCTYVMIQGKLHPL